MSPRCPCGYPCSNIGIIHPKKRRDDHWQTVWTEANDGPRRGFPSHKPWELGEYDGRELDRLRDHGIKVIQVWLEWCDELRLFGGDKFTPANPDAFRRFVDMVHARGMKILPYTSAGYFERRDPDFRPKWSRSENQDLRELCWDWARCSYASAGWRARRHLHPAHPRLLDRSTCPNRDEAFEGAIT